MKRNAYAAWSGDLKSGRGKISTHSGVLADTQYSFHTRFEDGAGTNPEELIAAAHAGCFSMALSHELSQAGHTVEQVATRAIVSLDKAEGGFAITSVHLDVKAHVPDISADEFARIANAAKDGCPVSKVLNAEISMETQLES